MTAARRTKERPVCLCGCGARVKTGKKYASVMCYIDLQRRHKAEAVRREHPGALVGREVEAEVERRFDEYSPVCPACGGIESRRREDCPLPVFIPPGSMPFLRFGCLSCTAEYLCGCGANPPSLLACGVYFLQCGEFIKIGIASDLIERGRNYLTDNPYPLELVGFLPLGQDRMGVVEAELHEHFASLSHRGEWFRAEASLMDWIDQHATKFLARIKVEYSL